MNKLLRIDASSRITDSASREIADFFQSRWEEKNPNGSVIRRDLAKTPIPHISNETIAGFYTDVSQHSLEMKEAVELSDQLISEVKEADIILLSSPLYNFNVPSSLKAYIDHLVRINQTFGMDEEGNFYGMIKDTKAYVVTAKGAVYNGTSIESLDLQDAYLKLILPFIGISLEELISVEGSSTDMTTFEKTKTKAEELITSCIN